MTLRLLLLRDEGLHGTLPRVPAAAGGLLLDCYAVYSRERLFETAPKAVMKLLMSIINNVNMVTTDARRYMSCLFDVVEEDGVKYSVPCAELVRFMEALQVVASVVGDA